MFLFVCIETNECKPVKWWPAIHQYTSPYGECCLDCLLIKNPLSEPFVRKKSFNLRLQSKADARSLIVYEAAFDLELMVRTKSNL